MSLPPPSLILSSDSSSSHWGAHIHRIHGPHQFRRQARGSWSQSQRVLHINHKELLAVQMALSRFLQLVKFQTVQVQSDNKTVVALINLQGTVRSIPLHNSTHTLLTWCQSHKIRLTFTYLPGILNILADRLSRPTVFSTEWSLNLLVVNHLFQR